jgi:hypothetical protein
MAKRKTNIFRFAVYELPCGSGKGVANPEDVSDRENRVGDVGRNRKQTASHNLFGFQERKGLLQK